MGRLFLNDRGAGGSRSAHPWAQALSYALVFAALALALTFAFHQLRYRWDWSGPWRYRTLLWQGWVTTLALAVGSLALSTFIGAVMALLGRSRFMPARAFTRIYVETIRGTPLLVQILILFYVIAPSFHLGNRHVVGVLALSLFAGAYLAEIFRAGIESVGASQWESARAIGLTPGQTYRHIVLPQALRHVLPPFAGQLVSLIKDSSLLSVIGIAEFTLSAQQVNALTYSTLESYIPLAIGYMIITLPISLWAGRLERRVHFET